MTDKNLIHLPTEIKRLQDEAIDFDFNGERIRAKGMFQLAAHYEQYMHDNDTEYYPLF